MVEYTFDLTQERRLREIVDELTSSGYVKRITEYDPKFFDTCYDLFEDDLTMPEFRDEKLDLIAQADCTVVLPIADILLTAENEGYQFCLFDEETSKSVREQLMKSKAYSRLVHYAEHEGFINQERAEKFAKQVEGYGVHPKDLKVIRGLRGQVFKETELEPIAKLGKKDREILLAGNICFGKRPGFAGIRNLYFYEADQLVEVGDQQRFCPLDVRVVQHEKTLKFLKV
ncbi:hypothetical protein GOV06_01345 [Candidatus Woesearchaeota archaeon]|nr:hypothetical protein [Candidatus Woesearchaeota archaeon]